MPDPFPIPELALNKYPPVSFHFMVTFLIGGLVPNLLDIRFQRVSGISAEIETDEIREGGENLFRHRLPNRMSYGNLILERGMIIGSILNVEFNLAMSTLRFQTGSVLVMLLNEESTPIASWLFQDTYPVKWAVSDLDASQNSVVIDTMELAYTRFQSLRI